MRHSTVTAPIESCNASSLNSSTSRFCALRLLHGQTLYFVVEPKSKTKELYNQACVHLTSQGMLDTDLFGLAVIFEGEYLFVDPDYKLSKYAAKNWRSSSTHGLDGSGEPLLVFYFRVQFYIDDPQFFHDETSRHQYYLQLRQNVSERTVAHPFMAEDVVYLLVGLALQADFGDYNDTQHKDQYFVLQEYFPQQMVTKGHEVRLYQRAVVVHKTNSALSKAQAEIQFIREASSWDSFTLAHNSHLYRLKRKKHDPNPGDLWLAICTRGIELYEEKSNKPLNGTFLWNYIGKLCFDRKKFEIRSLHPTGERMIYYTTSDEKSKHLLTLCKLTHMFCIMMQSKLNELSWKEESEKKQCRDPSADIDGKVTDISYNYPVDQRVSVISTTSSNTTSGVVSDRVHSLDESEGDIDIEIDIDMEIMINSPPAASVESLALAHLRDSFTKESKKKKKSTFNPSCLARQVGNSEVQCTEYESSESNCNFSITPAPTDGSQCSSSCSTVVVTYSQDKSRNQRREPSVVAASNRSRSTNSSLELGYSHTAQNSVVSDPASSCLELDYSVQSANASSGIYTLQSNCETNTVATTAIAASSETSGLGQSVVEDSEGIRSRSGSMVSASGSFHGDGSDPSDTGHGTPLTAEELSDLIVGRSPKPCRGKYPSIATVSESLDSIADYVTLPPPPMPPNGRISLKPTEVSQGGCISVQNFFPPKRSDSTTSVARQGDVPSSSVQKCFINSVNNNRKYFSEEAMLQRQIQFQHLAGGYTSHLLMDTLANQQHMMRNTSQLCTSNESARMTNNVAPNSKDFSVPKVQETTGRIVSTKPQSNETKVQSSLLSPNSSTSNYATSISLEHAADTYPSSQTSSVSYPTFSDLSWKNEQCMNVNSVPIVGSNNYLDVRRSGAVFLQHIHEKFPPPPPPLLCNRQPPPPPPPPPPRNHYSIHPSSTMLHQFDQYRQQLYSDVDYVIYPMKDPAISKQEYLDSKEASGLCMQYLSQISLNSNVAQPSVNQTMSPGSYSMYSRDRKLRTLYRSTPNVAAAGIGNCVSISSHYHPPVPVKYASNHNLNTDYSTCSNSSLVYLPNAFTSSTSPLYSVATSVHSSSMQSLHPDSSAFVHSLSPFSNVNFTRAYSDDNILNLTNERVNKSESKFHKSPPPPPPPPYTLQKNLVCLPERISTSQSLYRSEEKFLSPTSKESTRHYNGSTLDVNGKTDSTHNHNVSLDICSLREKSRNLDLPLIAALCNDKSLLKQTNTVDVCKKQTKVWSSETNDILNDNDVRNETSPKTLITNSPRTHLPTNSFSKSLTACKTKIDTTPTKSVLTNGTDKSLRTITKTNVQKLAKSFDASRLNPLSCGSQIRSMMETSHKTNATTHHNTDSVSSTAKLKLVNAKLPRSGNGANKLKYSVSQPIQKDVPSAPPTTADQTSTKNSSTNCRIKYNKTNSALILMNGMK